MPPPASLPAPSSVRLEPVRAVTTKSTCRGTELDGALHRAADHGDRLLQLALGDLQDELVVDLQEHLRLERETPRGGPRDRSSPS